MIKRSLIGIVVLYAVSSCTSQKGPVSASIDSDYEKHAVNLYSVCASDGAYAATQKKLDNLLKIGTKTCVDFDQRIIGIEPNFVRVYSIDGEAWGISVNCEKPTPSSWNNLIGKPSHLALVANQKVLNDYFSTGGGASSFCGMFTASDKLSATRVCEEMLTAWGQEVSECSRPCVAGSDLPKGACVEQYD